MIKADLQWLTTVLGVSPTGTDSVDLTTAIGEISTDSRAIKPGQVFLALKGPNFDGTKFVAQVKDKGAVAVIVESPVDTDIVQFVVEDSLIALGQLGAAVAREVNPKIIAMTGSVGKTSVKEMCAAIMSLKGSVLATNGNFNNQIGVPLTLLRLEPQHEFAIVELGANHIGEIAYTTNLTKPNVAILNNVAEAHLEGFGDIFGVVQAKGEIFNGLTENGLAIVNGDSEHKDYWLNKLSAQFEKVPGRVVEFGLNAEVQQQDNGITATNIKLDKTGCASFTLQYQGNSISIDLTLPGEHNVKNALAASAACIELGATLEDIKLGLAQMAAVQGRVNLKPVSDQVLLIDDSYNANVQSVKAAIDLLASYKGKQVLVLGDMAELGHESTKLHAEVGEYALNKGIHQLYSFGVLSQSSSDVLKSKGIHFSSKQALTDTINSYIEQQLTEQPNGNITVLVKGSRSAKMELVVEQVIADNQQNRI
ncbi:UDP-N-acetylmuramoyl-tripeptide--D-alanyl-D-alanine ligase [Psychrosphaera haliotis]|nr:UDP-N-acetylmuramoyl-tripeptide--D-alanyl-D-alanine ligase [Psychrosphaera haliotis]